MVVHVHELVAEHAAQFALIENLQNALRAAYGRVMLVASGGERVGAHGRRDIDAGHRLAGAGGQFAYDPVQFRRFLFRHVARAHRGDGDAVGEPVGDECAGHADYEIHPQRVFTCSGQPPNQHDDSPHQSK